MKKKLIKQGNMPKVWDLLVQIHKEHPEAFDSPGSLETWVSARWVSLKNKEKCPNCGANMLGLHFEFDCVNAAMLIEMAEVVKYQVTKTATFTAANKVHVQSMQRASYAMKSRTTQLSKLGLIAKVINKETGKQEGGTWLITKRGWQALRGEKVPRWVDVWRGEIEERTDDFITIKEALQINREKVELARLRNKKIKGDFREYERSYSSESWAMFSQVHDGTLFG